MARKKIDDELNDFERQFIDVYFNTNFNGRLAYKFLKPHVKDTTADTEASTILSYPKVKDEIEKRQEIIRQKQTIKLEDNIAILNSLIYELKSEPTTTYDKDGKVITKRDNRALLGAVDQLNKLAGVYTKKVDVTINVEQPLFTDKNKSNGDSIPT